MILEVRFIAGRFHATPWGHHPNEAIAEWPPSPFRIHRALLDAWYRKCPDVLRDVVEGLLAAMAAPPAYFLPPARASHTRSFLAQRSEDPADRKLVFDGFVVVPKDEPVLVGWPGLRLELQQLEAAARLAAAVGYLGRSESWVEMCFAEDRAVDWNCVSTNGSDVGSGEVVSVAGVVPREAYAPPQIRAKVRKGAKPASPPDWLEALGWGRPRRRPTG